MPDISENNPYKCISREERDQFIGWRVKTQWKGEVRRGRFADDDYGGPDGALLRAINWRDDQDTAMGKPHTKYWVRSSGASGRGGKRYEWARS